MIAALYDHFIILSFPSFLSLNFLSSSSTLKNPKQYRQRASRTLLRLLTPASPRRPEPFKSNQPRERASSNLKRDFLLALDTPRLHCQKENGAVNVRSVRYSNCLSDQRWNVASSGRLSAGTRQAAREMAAVLLSGKSTPREMETCFFCQDMEMRRSKSYTLCLWIC